MRRSLRSSLLGFIAAGGGIGLAVAMGSSAGAAGPTTTTLGSTTGTPSQNICVASINCTYVPFTGVSNPELQVPFDGTVTSFSVTSGSATGSVHLRVLRPAANGQFTGVSTSPAETLNAGGNTFPLSPGLPVKAGDVLALDNDSSALMFDTSSTTPLTAYYQPGLADGATAAPNNTRAGYRLLLAATVQASEMPTTVTTTTTPTTPPGTKPVLSNVSQTHKIWRRGTKLATASAVPKIPVGTTFKFRLNARAAVTFTFRQLVGKRRPVRGKLSFLAHAGLNKLSFQGRLSKHRRLPVGRYLVTIRAINTGGQSALKSLRFVITK